MFLHVKIRPEFNFMLIIKLTVKRKLLQEGQTFLLHVWKDSVNETYKHNYSGIVHKTKLIFLGNTNWLWFNCSCAFLWRQKIPFAQWRVIDRGKLSIYFVTKRDLSFFLPLEEALNFKTRQLYWCIINV